MSNSTVASRRVERPGRIAPSFSQSANDKAAHRAAEYRRGDSDPNMDEALRRVQTELAYMEYAAQPLAEYEAWAGSAA